MENQTEFERHQAKVKGASPMYQQLDRYNLKMTVKDICVDFVDMTEIKDENLGTVIKQVYCVGVSVIVRLLYDEFNFHDHIGYGYIENEENRGQAVLEAKRMAIDDAVKRCIQLFGKDFCAYHNRLAKERLKSSSSSANK
ncbi:hypothetical protein ABK040_007523 [Willaertia magna]